jgi:hypothetical protein
MNDSVISLTLYRIFTGSLFFYYNSDQYELKSPSKDIKYQSELIYDNIVNEEKYYNWIREENLIETMISLGLWHQNTDNTIQQLEKKIDNLKVDLYTNRIKTKETEQTRKKIAITYREIDNISAIKHNFYQNTLEGYAGSIKNEFLICSTLYRNNKRVFLNINKDSTSYTQFNAIVSEINKHIIGIKDYKAIARSQLWKSYWNSGDKNNIFCQHTIDLTDEQRSLLNISRMYDSIYEHPECPEEKVIQDDDMLDGWMILQKRNADRSKKQKLATNNNKISESSEVFIVTEDSADAKNVLELNTDEGKALIREKITYVNSQSGTSVEEFNLPDVQRGLLQRSRQK